MANTTYSPDQVDIVWVARRASGSVTINLNNGAIDGAFADLSHADARTSQSPAGDGSVTVVKNVKTNGTLSVTVQQNSVVNQLLNEIYAEQQQPGAKIVAGGLTVKENESGTEHFGRDAHIAETPSSGFGIDQTDRTWVLNIPQLTLDHRQGASL